MALTEGNEMVMPVSPMYGGGSNSGFFGNDGWWIILLFILLGGWGNGFGGNGNGVTPWQLANNTDALVTAGFNQAATAGTLAGIQSSITSGFGDVQNALCGGFAGVNAGVANGFAQAEIANNARQIADMQQNFAAQTAVMQGFNSLQSQFAQCCCDNRAGLADLRYTVATEACADRSAVNEALRDVLAANTASTQRILDQLCQDKIDAKNEKIADLQSQLQMAQLAASQSAQTAAILANNEAQTATLEQYLAPVPRPAYVVQNPNGCAQSCGCGY